MSRTTITKTSDNRPRRRELINNTMNIIKNIDITRRIVNRDSDTTTTKRTSRTRRTIPNHRRNNSRRTKIINKPHSRISHQNMTIEIIDRNTLRIQLPKRTRSTPDFPKARKDKSSFRCGRGDNTEERGDGQYPYRGRARPEL